jgi:hypothetical protein
VNRAEIIGLAKISFEGNLKGAKDKLEKTANILLNTSRWRFLKRRKLTKWKADQERRIKAYTLALESISNNNFLRVAECLEQESEEILKQETWLEKISGISIFDYHQVISPRWVAYEKMRRLAYALKGI